MGAQNARKAALTPRAEQGKTPTGFSERVLTKVSSNKPCLISATVTYRARPGDEHTSNSAHGS